MLFTKIRYRFVFLRTQKLNKNGTSVVQIEATQNKVHKYFSTRVYLEADQWDFARQQVINREDSDQLNAYLYELKMKLEQQELLFWKLGKDCTLDMLKQATKGGGEVTENFCKFAYRAIRESQRKAGTKQSLISTIKMVER